MEIVMYQNQFVSRKRSTTRDGRSFSETTIEAVWRKAISTNRNDYKKDQCHATIYRHSYGKTSLYGWEIDHIKPISQGGTDVLSNLQPLHWENNRKKSDNLKWSCAVTT